MISFSVELFFQIINSVLLVFILILGYKLICYLSDFLCKVARASARKGKR